ncbi:hypothetical protein D8674_017115 [Pyrus ussuriensis x Pyrus communis]|uniref:Uncharacterized protein n=1 Tax=Pyrus ussuriensis x Pyrus communis TaxID=2448454 RepID=A0A5N5HC50_9ROSA|nr:hypothetical protein D8674_017115 [Pyrus ussuriensis x Pyrus communis]
MTTDFQRSRRISSDLETQITLFSTDLENSHESLVASLSCASVNLTVIYVSVGRFLLNDAMFPGSCKNNLALCFETSRDREGRKIIEKGD